MTRKIDIGYLFGKDSEVAEILSLVFYEKKLIGEPSVELVFSKVKVRIETGNEYEGYSKEENVWTKRIESNQIYDELIKLEERGFFLIKNHEQMVKEIAKHI